MEAFNRVNLIKIPNLDEVVPYFPRVNLRAYFAFLAALLLLFPHAIPTKPEVTIGTVMPDQIFLRRQLAGAAKKAVKYLADMNDNYTWSCEVIFLKEYSPTQILEALCDDILAKKVNTIMYLSNGDHLGEHTASGQYLLQTANFLGIPVIAWNGDNSGFFQPTAESTILQMAPSIGHQCRAMLALMRRYNWRAFSIVTGSVAGEDHFISTLRDLTDQSEDWFEVLSIHRVTNPSPAIVREQLKKLSVMETRLILLYASRREAESILEVAAEMKLTGKEYVWIVSQSVVGDHSNRDSRYMPKFPIGLLGIAYKTDHQALKEAINHGTTIWGHGLQNLFSSIETIPSLHNISLVPDLTCEEGSAVHWKHGQILYNFLRNVSLDDVKPPINFNEDGTVTDTEFTIVNLNADHQWKEIGHWTMMDGIHIDDITWPGDAPTPPKGRPAKYHMKVVTLQERPYIMYSDPDPKTGTCPPQAASCRIAPLNETLHVPNATANASLYQCCSGFCIDLLKILSEKIGFEYDLFEVEDRKFGAFDREKKEWNGLVRALMDEKADMSLASLSITPERNQMIDFSVPFLETGITIIVAVRDGVISPTAFLEPFDELSWTFILVLCINVTAVTVFLFEWISPIGYDMRSLPPKEPYDYPSWCLILVFSVHASGAAIFIYEWLSPSGLDRGNKPIREHRFSLFRSFWLIWAMLFGAAVNTDNPRGASSRFMANIWALFAVVFTASYTANLAAFMITKEDYDRLTGIQDWRLMNPYAHKPQFKFATMPHGSTETNLRKNYPKMYNYMKPYNKSTVIEGVKAVKEQEINAFIYDATVLEYLAGHDDGCKLRTVGNWYAMTGYGIGFPQGSKWIDLVNRYLTRLQYDGEMERLQKYWLAGACSQKTEEGESSMPLGILNFTSAFILLAGGMLLGGLLLLLEHIYFKFFRRRLRKWDKCGCCGLVSLPDEYDDGLSDTFNLDESMGKSLTFEQSVREAMEMQKNYKCKNPMCETQMWKVRHELDLALLRIDRLQKQLGYNLYRVQSAGTPSSAKPPPIDAPTHTPAAAPPPHVYDELPHNLFASLSLEFSENDMSKDGKTSWKDNRNKGPPPAIGWKSHILRDNSQHKGLSGTAGGPAGGPALLAGPSSGNTAACVATPRRTSRTRQTLASDWPRDRDVQSASKANSNKKGSKSLPSSPVKRHHNTNNWPRADPPDYAECSKYNNGPMKRATSFPNTRDDSLLHKKNDKKIRYHKGNMYIEIDDDIAVEKETVL